MQHSPPALPLVPASSQDADCKPHFCPQAGMQRDGSRVSHGDQLLLHRRLRMAAWIMTAGFFLFLVRNLYWGPPENVQDFGPGLALHICVTVGCGLLAGILTWLRGLCFPRLRLIEALLFGSIGAFFAVMQYEQGCWCGHHGELMHAHAYIAELVVPWIVLVQVYGLFIPNTLFRAVLIIGLMALAPLLITGAVAAESPAFRGHLMQGDISMILLWMVVPAAASIYGSHRIELLDQQIRDARQLGAYTLRRRLGAGGMGEVYLAEHHLLKRPAAIKLIQPNHQDDPQAIARFESEVRTTAQLTHPNTVEIYDFGHADDGTFYYVMEYLPGMDLEDLVDNRGPLPPGRAIYLLRQVCSALSEAHAQGVIHRDLKPGNIIASQRGGLYDVAKLLDFGLVKTVLAQPDSLRLTQQGTFVGSPLYSPPELVLGDGTADARTDIYSLGATAYFLVTGSPVFDGEQAMKVMFAHVHDTPVPPSQEIPGFPADLEAIILKCLEKNPANRFQTARELEEALDSCAAANDWSAAAARKWWEEELRDKQPATPREPTPADRAAALQATVVVNSQAG